MATIRTRYIGPEGYAGSKIRAHGNKRQATIGYPHEAGNREKAHEQAARALATRLGIPATTPLVVVTATVTGYMFETTEETTR